MRYFRGVLTRLDALPGDGAVARALDVGSGRGFLAEEFCRLGFAVTGVDPSEVSVRAVHAHAAASQLNIDYRVGFGERLPVEDAAFDVAYCCDVLEHVEDVDRVLPERRAHCDPAASTCSLPRTEPLQRSRQPRQRSSGRCFG